ncbi:hypothetical protein [Sphingomonas faeni]|nr:hypothetical protein [Sphingomonas faeni]MCP8890898.1 hypothetical protein [Sphingomonas faeni]
MAADNDDMALLRETIERALSIADARLCHLVAALLAHCLDEIDRDRARDS